MKFYGLDAAHSVEDFLQPNFRAKPFDAIAIPCADSEFQFLDRKPLRIEIDSTVETSGVIIPDFIYERGIPLISERFKDVLDRADVDNLFVKKIILSKNNAGWEEIFWLALPPRIDCLQPDRCEISPLLRRAERLIVNPDRIGRYKMFKAANVSNVDIILTEDLAQTIRAEDLIGVHVFELD